MIRCIQCEQEGLESKLVHLPGTIRGESCTVEMQGLECPSCGYKTIEGSAMPEYGRLLADRWRAGHGLLTSEEIRSRRKRLHMNQQEFARHLDVGVASVKRWEMGKIQDEDSNRRILERTETPAYSLAAWGAHFAPIADSTLRFSSACRIVGVGVETEGTFSVIDFTGLPHGQSRYTGQTIHPNGVWISVDDREDSVIHARYRTADHTQARRYELRSLGQVH